MLERKICARAQLLRSVSRVRQPLTLCLREVPNARSVMMTGSEDSEVEGALLRNFSGTRVVRACGALIALLLVAAVVYGAVMVLENYAQISV